MSSLPHLLRLAAFAVTFLTAASAARAADVYGPPTSVHALWFRVGFTTGGHFSYGVAAEAIPFTLGFELSPHSEAGLVRVFAGLKANELVIPESGCAGFGGISALVAAAFGPGTPPQLGLRAGVHLRHMSMRNDFDVFTMPSYVATKRGEGISYNFTWLHRTGAIHDGGLELGAFRAPGSDCYGD